MQVICATAEKVAVQDLVKRTEVNIGLCDTLSFVVR
jgi:hypothetical protein